MQKISNDKSEKLNNSLIGADAENASKTLTEEELRLKFKRELEEARERAEVRIFEADYAKSFKKKLSREKSAAQLRKEEEKSADVREEKDAEE